MHKVFALSNKHLNNLWWRAGTYVSLSNPFSFAIFSFIPLIFWMFLSKKMYMCYPNLSHSLFCFVLLVGLFYIFVLFLGLGQKAQQVVCGATSLGQQTYLPNLLGTFNMHFTNLFFLLLFSSSLYPLSFGCFDILYTCGMVCFIPCFYLSTDCFFLHCVHVFGFGARRMAPLSFGSFSFTCVPKSMLYNG